MTSRWISEGVLEEYRQRAREYFASGNDIVVFGHTHRPEIRRWGDKVFCNPGEWIRRYTYAKLENGEMSLWEYFPDKPPQRITESS
jgi:predicted phosphodiesterase